jgi:predicted PurR-regulated permease PerM
MAETVNVGKGILRSLITFLIWFALLAFAIFVVVMVWRLFSTIVTYIVIALVVSSILRTPTNYLSQLEIWGVRLTRTPAILLSFGVLFGIVALFIALFSPLISDQIAVISTLDLATYTGYITTPLAKIEQFLIQYGLSNEPEGFLMLNLQNTLQNYLNPDIIRNLINDLLSITGNFFIGLIAVLFITFFFLYEKGAFRKNIINIVPNRFFEVSIAAFSKTERLLSNYLLGLFLQMLAIFTIASVGLVVLGVKYGITIALFAAIANLVPFLGPILGAAFGIFVGLSTNAQLPEQELILVVIKVVSVFAVVQLSDNIFLQPIIFSKSVKAHPVVIFLVVIVGGTLSGGPLGMIVAIPVFTVLKVTFAELVRGYRQYQVFRR